MNEFKVGDEFESKMSGTIYEICDINLGNPKPIKVRWEDAAEMVQDGWIEPGFLEDACKKINKTKYDKQKQSLKV